MNVSILGFMWLRTCHKFAVTNKLGQTYPYIQGQPIMCVCDLLNLFCLPSLSLSLWAIFQTILYTINSGKKSKTNKSEHQANNMPIRQMFLCIPTPIQLMKQLASSEMMWYVLSGDNISPTYNARSLIQRAWSRSPAALAFCWSKMLNVFSAYVLFFLCLPCW